MRGGNNRGTHPEPGDTRAGRPEAQDTRAARNPAEGNRAGSNLAEAKGARRRHSGQRAVAWRRAVGQLPEVERQRGAAGVVAADPRERLPAPVPGPLQLPKRGKSQEAQSGRH